MRSLTELLSGKEAEPTAVGEVPLGGTRSQAVHRLQIGLAGIGAMVLMIGLADVIMDRAQQTQATVVPEAASTVAAEQVTVPQNDPLAEAGVVPDLPAEPTPTATQEQAIMPEQGNAPAQQE